MNVNKPATGGEIITIIVTNSGTTREEFTLHTRRDLIDDGTNKLKKDSFCFVQKKVLKFKVCSIYFDLSPVENMCTVLKSQVCTHIYLNSTNSAKKSGQMSDQNSNRCLLMVSSR